jgi:hypothetical protein
MDRQGADHYAHTQMKKNGKQIGCRDCHVVDDEGAKPSYALVKGAPGHAQCLQCHNNEGPGFALSECGSCHKDGSRREFIRTVMGDKFDPAKDVETRPGSRVRECEGEGAALYNAKQKRKVPCFKHETKEHRTKKDGSDVQCATCHYLVTDKKQWVGGRARNSIADLHRNSIIHSNPSDDMEKHHAACSGRGCHAGQTELGPAKACTKCHADL